MKETKVYFAFLFFVLTFSASAQMFELTTKDAHKIQGRTLLVVLQEEDPQILGRLKKNETKLAQYKAVIQYHNDLLTRVVSKYWKAKMPVVYKKFSECKTLVDTSTQYLTLEFASLRQNENIQLYYLKPDTNAVYPLRTQLMERKEFGFFDLKLIEKYRGTPVYIFNTPSSVPNEYDFVTAIQVISALIIKNLEDPKFTNRDYELLIQKSNAKLTKKVLMVDSAIVPRHGKTFDYIRKEYDTLCLYELSDPEGIMKKINAGDSSSAYLNVVPYVDLISRNHSQLGTTGGNISDYDKTIYYFQVIIDPISGEIYYYDKTETKVLITRDWRRFLRFSRDEGGGLTLPNFQKTTNPTNNQNYPGSYDPQRQYYKNEHNPY